MKKLMIFLFCMFTIPLLSNDTIYTKEKHTKTISDIAFSEDDTLLATVSEDKTIYLWDMKSKNLIKKLQGHTEGINHVVLNRKRGIAVTTSFGDHKMILWDIKQGKKIKVLNHSIVQTNNIALSKDGRFLILVNRPNIFVYDLVTLKILYEDKVMSSKRNGMSVLVSFIDNDNKVFINIPGVGMKVYSFNKGQLQEQKKLGYLRENYTAIISDDARYLAVQEYHYNSDFVEIYDLKTQKKVKRFYGISCFDKRGFISKKHLFYFNNKTSFFGSAYQKVYSGIEVYDINSGKRVKYYNGTKISKLSHNKTFYIDSSNKSLNIYNINTGKQVASLYPNTHGITHSFVSNETIYAQDTFENLYQWDFQGIRRVNQHSWNKKIYSMSLSKNYIAYEMDNDITIKKIDSEEFFRTIHNPKSTHIKRIFLINDQFLCIVYKQYSILYNFQNENIVTRINEGDIENIKMIGSELFISSSSQVYGIDTITMTQTFKKYLWNVANYNFDISSNHIMAIPFSTSRILLYNYKLNKSLYSIYAGPYQKRIIKFSSDDKYLAFNNGNDVIIWDINNNKQLKKLHVHSGKITSLNYTSNGKYFISSSQDGFITVYNAKNYVELVRYASFGKEEWVTLTSEGYFSGSENAVKFLLIRTGDLEVGSFEQFYDHFFRPDLIKLKLQGKEKEYQKAIQGMSYQEALKNPPPKLAFKSIDSKDVKLSGFSYNDVKTKKEIVKLSFNVFEHDNGGVGLIRVYQEGKLIKTIGKGTVNKQSANLDTILEQEKLDTTNKKNQKMYIASLSKSINSDVNMSVEDTIAKVNSSSITNISGIYTLDIELKSGRNEISIEAFNKTNTVTSYRENITINADIPKHKPKLYAIVAGVNEFEVGSVNNLKYSQNDAKAIKEAAENKMGTVFDKVEVKYLLGKDVTKENILKAANEISKVAKLDDTVLFYISTHGRAYKGKLYLVPYNNKSVANWIDFEQTFKAVQSIKALNQIFIIDACESGKANDIVSSVYDSRASVLAKSSGVHMLLATTKGTSAFEHPDKSIHNGVFTHRILQAMKDKTTDTNKDSLISVLELSKKLKEPNNNTDYQHPVIRNVGNDIQLEKIDDE